MSAQNKILNAVLFLMLIALLNGCGATSSKEPEAEPEDETLWDEMLWDDDNWALISQPQNNQC